jgi:RNA polymerase sigma-70 factor (ECF subfamily)
MATVVQPAGAPFRNRFARSTVMGVAASATTTPGADEVALAQRAAAGDGDAFATLYGRYESRVYNLCFRILGSQDDAADAAQEAFVNVLRRLPKLEGRELAFGSYVFTSARNACYDLIQGRRRSEPSDSIPEYATPVGGGVGGGGMGFDPGDPEDDPERNVLLDARTEEIRLANLALPERQREALALKELEDLSYDEVAEIMGMNRNSVAQLISRARINLRDALRGAALGAIVPNAPQCERAVPLIASLDDDELAQESAQHEWLMGHLVGCDLCRMRREAMEEAGVSYRAWLPISAGPLLFRETMAEAAELVGADWSEVVARRNSTRSGAGPAAAGGAGGAGTDGARAAILRHRRLDIALMGLLGLILVLVAFVGPTSDGSPTTAILPASDEQPAPTTEAEAVEPAKKKEKKKSGGDKNRAAAAAPAGESAGQAAQADEEPASTGGQTSTGTDGGGGAQRQSSSDGKVDRDGSGGSKDDVTGDPPSEPPPPADVTADPPPPPPPADTTPTNPRVCRDPATGAVIPCGTAPPPRTPPPRTPPPTRTPPPR